MENIDIIMIMQIYLPLNEYHKNKEVDDKFIIHYE